MIDGLLTHFGLGLALAAGLALIAVWAPRKVMVKALALLLAFGFMPIAYASMADLLSKPKPITQQWMHGEIDNALILGARLQHGQRIFLWVEEEGDPEPKYFALPWDDDTAKELHEAMREAEDIQGEVRMSLDYERSWDPRKPEFHANPPPKLPEKLGQEDGQPFRYKHPEGQAI